jgi:hypothetical protein
MNESKLPFTDVNHDLTGIILHSATVGRARERVGTGRYVTTCSACTNVIARGTRRHCLYWAQRHHADP